MAGGANDGKPTAREKRRRYAIFFVIAFLVDLTVGLLQRGAYTPTLVGMAIMSTAALFFVISLVRDR